MVVLKYVELCPEDNVCFWQHHVKLNPGDLNKLSFDSDSFWRVIKIWPLMLYALGTSIHKINDNTLVLVYRLPEFHLWLFSYTRKEEEEKNAARFIIFCCCSIPHILSE